MVVALEAVVERDTVAGDEMDLSRGGIDDRFPVE